MNESRRFEFVDPSKNANKFWQISITGSTITKQWGRIGTLGQTQEKTYKDPLKAREEFDSSIWEKISKGYKQTAANQFLKKVTLTPDDIGFSRDSLLEILES